MFFIEQRSYLFTCSYTKVQKLIHPHSVYFLYTPLYITSNQTNKSSSKGSVSLKIQALVRTESVL